MIEHVKSSESLDQPDNMVESRNFHHPYTPYSIQETFMHTVYQTLEDAKVGILESPTGTGKSLSLICGSLTWLRDHKRQEFENGLQWDQGDSDEPAWLIDQTKARKRRDMLRQREDMEARLAKIRAKEDAQKQKYLKGDQNLKRRKVDIRNDESEEQFVLEDYDSDGEQMSNKCQTQGLYSAETLALMEQLGMTAKPGVDDVEGDVDELKIFYCSRTHSQLSQFINELRRPKFPAAFQDENTADISIDGLKHVTLGSRKNMCINPAVKKLSSLSAINEKCTELQQSTTPLDHKCPFIPNKDNQVLVNEFRDHTLASLRDIEDMGKLGKQIGICPYYAARAAVKSAEIVTLPYPLLLQKSAREALDIDLKGHVVIIDEAHNLMDAIAGIHSVEISLKQLQTARAQMGGYLQKFRNRLKGKNRVYVAQVIRVIDSLSGFLQARSADPGATDGIASDKDILSGKGADQVDLYKLIKYLHESKLARKVEGYTIYSTEQSKLSTTPTLVNLSRLEAEKEAITPVLHQVTSMLTALTHLADEGKFFFNKAPAGGSVEYITLKFQLLDPSSHFAEITSSARAVLLAGGTMSPMSDYTSHLFPLLPSEKITTLSCGHVIPKENLIAWNLGSGPSGKPFEFTFKNRTNFDMIDELGRALLNICSIVPDGVVVFFPSYQALADITKRWQVFKTPGTKSILERLESKKALFRESKEESVDTILSSYAQAIDAGTGALLLSVVGGKMSEGINFSDALGRCVVIIGLPFPNINSAEWKAKISYIESATIKRLSLDTSSSLTPQEITAKAKEQAREFYENACMRAVNQSVGRAIRHSGDYASVIMIDQRFSKDSIRGKLPGWIRDGLVEGAAEKSFANLMGRLGAFYRAKKQ